ncbi:hypothetical protein KIW84_025359 [Lathyrus oleraceus]|uniref:Uncharacterized protein n=1 Tax=Pisum sativum TaxID=3888 RepID=A0A9D4YK94_PEA|nr:hypothetical protein KIW84_025359 [Pisum sativum]
MAPPKASKGKGKIGEGSNAPDSDPEQFQPSLKQRRMMTSFRQRNVLLPKFGNVDTFPSSSFQFPAILHYQGVVDFVLDSGLFYQDLVREFYAHFTILPGCAFSTIVRGTEIAMSLEDVGVCLDVPSEGERISHGFTPDTEGWENFNNLRFYFSLSRISEQEFYACHARSNSTKLFLSSKNLSDVDGLYEHTDAENVYAPPPSPVGGYTLELIYNKLHEMDIHHSFELWAMHYDINFLKQQHHHHNEGVEEEEEDEDEEYEEMEDND